jgi:hypothetical protein
MLTAETESNHQIGEWINRLCYIHTMEHYTARKRNEVLRLLLSISGRALAQHGQGPGFDPQHCKNLINR